MSRSDSKLALAFVGAIIERQRDGKRQLLIQTRQNPKYQSIYNGTLEFAAGMLDSPYENVYDAIAREIKEETGLTLKRILDDSQTEVHTPRGNDGAFGFRPFCCVQQLYEGAPWVGFIFRVEVEDGNPIDQPGETNDVHWHDAEDFQQIFQNTPEKIFTLELPAWDYYFREIA